MMSYTYVLIHGGRHGGWCWRDVAAGLRELGHLVHTPTITGVGDRAHLLDARITLETAITDTTSVIETEELNDVVLVGHSFGGMLITGVADRMPERLKKLVYLDAVVPRNDWSLLDSMDQDVAKAALEEIETRGGGTVLPLFENAAAAHGIADPQAQAWVNRRLTPHPARTVTDKLRLTNPVGNGVPAVYVRCDSPSFYGLEVSRQNARDLGFPFVTLHSGHDAMVISPTSVVQLLLKQAETN